jgi:hypothetical protein
VDFRLPKVLEQNERPQTLKSILCNFFQPNLMVLPCLDLKKIENSKKLTPKLLVVPSMVIQEIKPYKKVFDRFHNTMSIECFKMKLN